MTLTPTETMLSALVRAALWQQPAATAPFTAVTDADWASCLRLAAIQGVQAVAFDGAATLPPTLQPPRPLKLAWAAGTEAIAQQHKRHLTTLARLVHLFAAHGISVMLLKGPGLAADYPIPAHRESGDLDIWLCGEYDRGNRIIAAQGITVSHHNPKHSCFWFEDIPVENHRTFLNVTQTRTDRHLEPHLTHAIAEGGNRCLHLPGDTLLTLPPVMFNAIFLARHMCVHLPSGIAVRHLCDWACFLHRHHGQYDAARLTAVLSNAGILTPVSCLTRLAVDYLGLPPAYSPFTGQHGTAATPPPGDPLSERLLADILRPQYATPPPGRNPLRTVAFKWKRLRAGRWKYELVQSEGFHRRVAASVISHLLHPGTILKLK